jgi:proline iminopeptidase
MHAYYKRLTGSDREAQLQCARAWSKWEMATCKLYMDPEALKRAEDDEFALAFARIECHYFVNNGFFDYDGQLLAELDKIRHIPTTVVQGRFVSTAGHFEKVFRIPAIRLTSSFIPLSQM